MRTTGDLKVLSRARPRGKQLQRGHKRTSLLLGDAETIMRSLPEESVDCLVTSPPYYGQRDYGMDDQVGLEADPMAYVERLVAVFNAAMPILKKTGSLWINLGDTYWSGKGAPHGSDGKNKHRRFLRPQDRKGPHNWCRPKQLLLLPHRVAIGLQEKGWILRNDNVWQKTAPTPDPVRDRCAAAHEYFFHFVRTKNYFFNFEAVAEPCVTSENVKPPPSVWAMPNRPNFKKHAAVFPPELVRLPLLATLPKRGVVLDPFCGSGTALEAARRLMPHCKVMGIDLSPEALKEASVRLECEVGLPKARK